MKRIAFNFTVPKKYRREFHLFLPGERHRIFVDNRGISLTDSGVHSPEHTSAVLDWIQESIESVRGELGE